MAVNITDANTYIEANVIDNEDWRDADDAKKQRILNVAQNTLTRRFPDYIIPDEAVYEFAAVLAVVFNDTNRLKQHGIDSFSIEGVGSFKFRGGPADIEAYIPKTALAIIGDANGVKLSGGRRVMWTVL
jgi:hypothetical protein